MTLVDIGVLCLGVEAPSERLHQGLEYCLPLFGGLGPLYEVCVVHVVEDEEVEDVPCNGSECSGDSPPCKYSAYGAKGHGHQLAYFPF